MAILTPSLTISANANTASTNPGLESDALSFTVTDTLTVTAPSSGLTRVSTAANPLGAGAGILLTEAASTTTTYVYIKHLGVLASDGTTASHASNDFITLSNEDGDVSFIKLQPEEFAFFPLLEFDGSDGGVEPGGLKVTAGSAAVMIEYACWTRG
tara:strand:- start:43 stop:510 length:468 start_codon:yes stop_codon:yes gene_type:complete